MDTILFCTVGGSPEPILKALSALEPAYVYFVCTDRDPATAAPGSRREVEGSGRVIKAHPADETPTLPNIPTQARLAADQYELLLVDSDDLDGTFVQVNSRLRDLSGRSDLRIVADYTGGTKTMAAGLVIAALEHGGVELQLVTGSRPDLQQVKRGTEHPYGAEVNRLRIDRGIRRAVAAWQYFAYDTVADTIDRLDLAGDARLRALPTRARDISQAFADWDRFAHESALERLTPYRGLLASAGFMPYFSVLERLLGQDPRGGLLRLLDLWRNAERRATQSRFDDAVARCYRTVEGLGQWLLWSRAGIDTADVPADAIPENLQLPTDAQGRRQAALDNAWQIAARVIGGDTASFYQAQREHLLDLLKVRNHSILAHGWIPIEAGHWRAWQAWMEQQLVPFMLLYGQEHGVNEMPPQLPMDYPEALLRVQ